MFSYKILYFIILIFVTFEMFSKYFRNVSETFSKYFRNVSVSVSEPTETTHRNEILILGLNTWKRIPRTILPMFL